MLIIFIGSDVGRAKEEVRRRAAGSELVRVGEGGVSYAASRGYLEQQGMFTPQVTLLFDRPLDDMDGKTLLFEEGEVLVQAHATVYAVIPEISAIEKKKIPAGALIEFFEHQAIEKGREAPSVFALTDAFAAGDRKKAWVTYRTLLAEGVQPEEIHGALAWSVRSMVLAGKTKSASEAGMKDYPYKKAKSTVLRVGDTKAAAWSAELVRLYHEARKGSGTLEDHIEIFLLQK